MILYKTQSKRGIKKKTFNTICVSGYTISALLAVGGAFAVYSAPDSPYIYSSFFVAAAIVALIILLYGIFAANTVTDRRSVGESLTITENNIHGITCGIIFNESLESITDYYVDHSKLTIITLTNVYEFSHLSDPQKAVKTLDLILKKTK